MTKEEFAKKLESDDFLRKAFEADPMKVIQENNVELSEEDLANVAGGSMYDDLKFMLNLIKKNKEENEDE